MNPRKAQFEAARKDSKFPEFPLRRFKEHDDLLQQLTTNGWCKLPCVLAKDELVQIVWDVSQRNMYGAHVKAQSDGVPRTLPELRKTSAHACLDTSDTLRILPLLDKCLDESILALASGYFDGALPICYSMNAWWSFPNAPITTTQGWHRDHDTFRFLSCFVFLSSTGGARGGETMFVRHSHDEEVLKSLHPYAVWINGITQEQAQANDAGFSNLDDTLAGQPGEIFLADTWGWHKAALPKADRLVAWFRYAINKPESFAWDKLDEVRKLNADGMTEVQKHVLQFFL